MFAEKGFHNASIRDVSRASGVSLSGLYHYFGSKDELLYLIQDQAMGRLLESLETELASIEEPVDRLRVFISGYLTYFVANMARMKVMSHEAESLTGELGARVRVRKRAFIEILAPMLEALRPDSPVDGRIALFSLFGMLNGVYTWYRPERDGGVERLAAQMTQLFLAGYLECEAPAVGAGRSAWQSIDDDASRRTR